MKIALVCSQGGHLTQILQILDAFAGHDIFFVTHYSVRDAELRSIATVYLCKNIGERIHRFLWTFLWALIIFIRERPQVIFSTGAEIAVPFFCWAKVLGIRAIFLDSWSRVKWPSRTGRLVYYLADEFWVQWTELLPAYGPKARFYGAVI